MRGGVHKERSESAEMPSFMVGAVMWGGAGRSALESSAFFEAMRLLNADCTGANRPTNSREKRSLGA